MMGRISNTLAFVQLVLPLVELTPTFGKTLARIPLGESARCICSLVCIFSGLVLQSHLVQKMSYAMSRLQSNSWK